MPSNPVPSQSVTLSLPADEQWTLHHILLERIEQEPTAPEPSTIDPPPVEVFQAFETLDAGETAFTLPELDAMQTVLAEYHHSPTWWELERAQIEQLLRRVSTAIKRRQLPSSAD